MPENHAQHHPPPLAGFIAHLKSRGFVVGVDQRLRLQAVLEMIGPDIPPAEIKYLLCPVFAVTERQQVRFYQAFDRYFHFLSPTPDRALGTTAEEPSKADAPTAGTWFARRWVVVLAGIIAFLAIGVFTYLGEEAPPPKDPIIVPPPKPAPPPETATPEQPPETNIPEPPPEANTPETPPETPAPRPTTTRVTLDLGTILTPPAAKPPGKAFWLSYLKWLAVAAPWLVFLLSELHRIQKRRLVIQRRRLKKPPFIWHLQVDAPDAAFLKDRTFYAAARKLRQRLESGQYRLDIPGSVAQAVAGAGFLADFHYQALTRPSEYLFLINLPAYRDHQARYFDTLTAALEKEDIDITRFFFREDPQICFQEVGGSRIEWSEIRAEQGRKRLVIFGDGEGLLDPATGNIEPWADAFRRFPDRAILTPRPPAEWDTREVALSRLFLVLPATPEGVSALVDHFEYPARYRLRDWAKSGDGGPDDANPEDPAALRDRLGEDTFQWLCACAVYPEVHWNLTLHLGIRLGHDLSPESLARLIRLPWFRQGEMPEALRLELIDHLSLDRLDAVREALFEILEDNPPAPASAAWDEYQLYLAAYSSRKKGGKGPADFRNTLENTGESLLTRDMTLLQFLESRAPGSLSLVLPPHLKRRFSKLLFRNRLSFFGLRTGVRALLALIFSAAALFLIPNFHTSESKKAPPVQTPVIMDLVYVPSEPGFYIQASPVTWNQWAAVMEDSDAAANACGTCPRENLSAEEMQRFVSGLNRVLGASDYRLAASKEVGRSIAEQTVPVAPIGENLLWVARPVRGSDYEGHFPEKVGLIPPRALRIFVNTQQPISEEPRPDNIEPDPGILIQGPFDMKFAYIPAGKFQMGSPEDEPGRYSMESPQHEVTISQGFFMQTTEVTQSQWKAVMGENSLYLQNCGNNCPVESVSWEDAKEFIRILNEKKGKNLYRLPTEAEWEYAARAGSQTAFANGEIQELECGFDSNLDQIGWYCGNSKNISHEVALKSRNAWGLYDMHGNVNEWCEDDYHGNYKGAPNDGSAWIDEHNRGENRIMRSGSWRRKSRDCRSAFRNRGSPGSRYKGVGFRLARSYPSPFTLFLFGKFGWAKL